MFSMTLTAMLNISAAPKFSDLYRDNRDRETLMLTLMVTVNGERFLAQSLTLTVNRP